MDRCSLCPINPDGRPCSRPIPASGPAGQCDILFLGAGPGKTESRTNIPYSGLAGDELNGLYLSLANLRRDRVVISNASLCWDGTDRTPSLKRIAACAAHHLPDLLNRVRPQILVLMGGATQSLSDTRIRLDLHHGIPQRGSILSGLWSGWIFPSYEPALGMRDTGMMSPLMDDFRRLGSWLAGDWSPPVAPVYSLDYRVAHTADDVDHYIRCVIDAPAGHDARYRPGCDTERHGSAPWSLQFSVRPYSGCLIRAGNRGAIEGFNRYLARYKPEMAWHNAPQDLDAAERMGFALSLARGHRDTMQEAYQLCVLPQGLKALVYRLFGVTMKSWEDVVWPASVAVMKAWLNLGIAAESTRPDVEIVDLKMGKCPSCGKRNKRAVCSNCGEAVNFIRREESANTVSAILSHILRYTAQTEENEKPYNPWKKLPEMELDGLRGKVAAKAEWDRLMEEVGEMPVLGIGNCEDEEAVRYAISDADWELQLAMKLTELRKGKRWEVDRQDYDE